MQAGGGIVADSDPEYEFTESVNKALAVLAGGRDGGDSASAVSLPGPTDPKASDQGRSPSGDAVRSRVSCLLLLAAAMICGFAATLPAASALALLALAAAPAIFAVPPRGADLGLAMRGRGCCSWVSRRALGDDLLAWASVAALVLPGSLIAWRGGRGRRWAADSAAGKAGAADPGQVQR